MRFRLLGPLEIRAGEDDWRGIGAPKWRSVLAALLINAGQIVPADALINEVWGETPPAKACRKTLRCGRNSRQISNCKGAGSC